MGKKKRNKAGQVSGSGAVATEIRQVAGSRPQGFSVSTETKTSFFSSRYFEWLALAVASVVSYWILTARLIGVNVSVLVDEYSYVLDAHYRELSEAAYPNHLFQLIYSTTKVCGPEFYSCARSLNALFVIGSGIIVYLLAKYMSKKYWLASAAFVVTVFGSMGTYTAYFMPEAIFNFFMVAFFFALTRFSLSNNLLVWAGMGAILGIASLAKPHAFFVVPALLVYIVLLTRATEPKFVMAAVKRLVVSGATLLGTKFGLGFAIAGERGLSIFGSYGGAISSGEAVASTLGVNTWVNVPVTTWGQILMITMILGVSLPVAILGLLESLKKDKEVFLANRFRSLFALSLLNMMAVVAVFEAWQNLTNWMHTRYNSYLIPLAIIVLIEAYIHFDRAPGKIAKRLTVGVITLLSLFALFTAAIPYGANWIDAPDFKAHIDNLVISSIAIVIAIALGLWWLWNTKIPVLVGIIFMVGTSVFAGTHISNFLNANFGQDTTHDHLGRVLRDYIPQGELDQTVLVGDNHTNMERALFSSLSGDATLFQVGEAGFSVNELGPEVRWLVKVGEPVIDDLGAPNISGAGFALFSLNEANNLDPRNNEVLTTSQFCSDQVWSCGNQVDLTLSKSASPFVVDLVLEVSEVASRGNLEFVMGGKVLTGQLPAGAFALSLNFANESEVGVLTIRAAADSEAASSAQSDQFVRIISANVTKR
jgi:phosphoglycerol transferase